MQTGRKVLVIDDDDLVLRTLEQVLKKQGYDYCLANNAQVAINHTLEIAFDIIISDIRMPIMNGVDALKVIQENRKKEGKPEIPVIFITGYAQDSIYLKAEKLGEVIQKPFDLDQLLMTIREYL